MAKERTPAEMKKVTSHPFMEPAKSTCVGIRPPTPTYKKNLTRYVRWPRYIRVQRQKRILLKRLKVPPAIAQFDATMDKNQTGALLKLLNQYKPETRVERNKRIRAEAAARAEGETKETVRALTLTSGIKEVVQAIEKGRAKLVCIAHDVDPIEIVVYLPALCRKFEVPYCFIRSKARLGQLVHSKTCTSVCVTEVNAEHKSTLEELRATFMSQYNNNVSLRRTWGGTIMSKKFMDAQAARAKLAAKK